MAVADVVKLITENDVKFVDLRFTDTMGKEQHVTIPAHVLLEDADEWFERGHAFDGSSIAGWERHPGLRHAADGRPGYRQNRPVLRRADRIHELRRHRPGRRQGLRPLPALGCQTRRSLPESFGIGDTAFFGPEPEFFIFDSITWGTDMSGCFVKIKAEEAAWASAEEFEGGNTGHRPGVKGGYFPVPPVDSSQDIRSAMVLLLEELGVPVEVHHHEVATAGQNEIGTKSAP